MKDLSYSHFCDIVAKRYNIDRKVKVKFKQDSFPRNNKGKQKIHMPHDSTIVDKKGIEHPYMLPENYNQRNDSKLKEFDHVYFYRYIDIEEIEKVAGIKIKRENCRVCEGGGWYSNGTRYIFEDYCCEV